LNLMDEDNPIDEISRIEARLEELAEVSERCRKMILVSKVAIAGGIALLLVMMLGLFGSSQVATIGSIAMALGGIVSLGSNVSTLRQTMAAMSAAEVLRSDLISRIDLQVVGDRRDGSSSSSNSGYRMRRQETIASTGFGAPGKTHLRHVLGVGVNNRPLSTGGKCPASPDITALALPIPRVIDRFTFSGWADQGSRVP
jgi:hypothetical protein